MLAFGPVYPFLAAAGVISFWTSWWALTSIVGAAEIGGRTKRWHVQGARGVPLLALFISMEVACVVNGLFFQTSRLGGPLFPCVGWESAVCVRAHSVAAMRLAAVAR